MLGDSLASITHTRTSGSTTPRWVHNRVNGGKDEVCYFGQTGGVNTLVVVLGHVIVKVDRGTGSGPRIAVPYRRLATETSVNRILPEVCWNPQNRWWSPRDKRRRRGKGEGEGDFVQELLGLISVNYRGREGRRTR